MTSEQTMQRTRHTLITAFCVAVFCTLAACSRDLSPPIAMNAPYDHPQVWAVAPFLNESGRSDVRGDHIADAMFAEVQQVRNIDAIPVNRVILAMRDLNLPAIVSMSDARAVMNYLNADAIIVGTVTTWDPYPPPTIGLATELYTRDDDRRFVNLDSVELTRNPRSSDAALSTYGPPGPAAAAAGVFKGANHQTIIWLNDYATHRAEPDSAFGRDIYLARMDLFTQFAAHRLLHDLLADQWQTVHRMTRHTE